MKKLFLLIFITIFSLSATHAQILKELEASTPKERATLFSNEITQNLMLTKTQSNLISAINLDHALKVVSILNTDNNKLKKLKKIKALDKLRDEKLVMIFTEEQTLLYKKHKKEYIKHTRQQLKSDKLLISE